MKAAPIIAGLALAVFCVVTSACVQRKSGAREMAEENIPKDEVWIHPLCVKLPLDRRGPFVERSDGSLMVVAENATRVSTDDGRTWSEPRPICEGAVAGVPSESSVILKTQSGVIVMVYCDLATSKQEWDYEKIIASEDSRIDVWSIRSFDDGQTWTDRQKILDGFGYLLDIIQTSRGEIVVPVQDLAPERTRHVQHTFVSADDGKTWTKSNMIDLGGHGDHDGAFEGTLAELRDGRLLMLLRTSLDEFWKAYSSDGGRHWRVFEPSGIDASNSPGHLVRLASGRLVLVWNRLYRRGENSIRRTDEYWTFVSEHPSSWMRDQLSIAFSDDDGETWTEPTIFLQAPGAACYPNVFERRPGELWITTGPRKPDSTAILLKESDFAGR